MYIYIFIYIYIYIYIYTHIYNVVYTALNSHLYPLSFPPTTSRFKVDFPFCKCCTNIIPTNFTDDTSTTVILLDSGHQVSKIL